LVVTEPPLIVVCPPFAVTTPFPESPEVWMVELVIVSVPPPG